MWGGKRKGSKTDPGFGVNLNVCVLSNLWTFLYKDWLTSLTRASCWWVSISWRRGSRRTREGRTRAWSNPPAGTCSARPCSWWTWGRRSPRATSPGGSCTCRIPHVRGEKKPTACLLDHSQVVSGPHHGQAWEPDDPYLCTW